MVDITWYKHLSDLGITTETVGYLYPDQLDYTNFDGQYHIGRWAEAGLPPIGFAVDFRALNINNIKALVSYGFTAIYNSKNELFLNNQFNFTVTFSWSNPTSYGCVIHKESCDNYAQVEISLKQYADNRYPWTVEEFVRDLAERIAYRQKDYETSSSWINNLPKGLMFVGCQGTKLYFGIYGRGSIGDIYGNDVPFFAPKFFAYYKGSALPIGSHIDLNDINISAIPERTFLTTTKEPFEIELLKEWKDYYVAKEKEIARVSGEVPYQFPNGYSINSTEITSLDNTFILTGQITELKTGAALNIPEKFYIDRTIKVIGIDDATISGVYTENPIYIYDDEPVYVDPNKLNITLTNSFGERRLSTYEFTYEPKEIKDEHTVVTVEYRNGYKVLSCEVDIYAVYEFGTIMVWYEGPDIIVGNAYNVKDLRIYLKPKRGDKRLLNFGDKFTLSSLVVTQEGDQWFTCSYKIRDHIVSDIFCVTGYIPKTVIDKNFKVLYIKDNNDFMQNRDVTEFFEPYLCKEGFTVISWKKFLECIHANKMFGLFILWAPANSGLDARFATKWVVINKNINAIAATRIQTFRDYYEPLKEDNDNGNSEDNSQEEG